MKAKLNPIQIARLADRLGEIKAAKTILANEEAEIKNRLLAADVREGEGDLFRFTLSRSLRSVIDYRAILDVLKPSRQLLRAHTRPQETETLRVVARTGWDRQDAA